MAEGHSGNRGMLKRRAFEFLVIVIGILSAFWVEEFRESRSAAADEAAYLARLLTDLDGGVEAMQTGLDWSDSRRAAGRALLDYLEAGVSDLSRTELILASFDVSLVPISAARRLGDRSTYEELLATGSVAVLQEAALREALATYYMEYERVGGRLLEIPQEFRSRSAGLLSPQLANRLRARRSTNRCFFSVPQADDSCDVTVGRDEEERFFLGLAEEPEVAWRELSRLVQYQDRQVEDVRGFLARTEALRALLDAS